MSEATENKLADFFNKNLAEPIKEKLKTIIAEFKAETTEVKAAEETPATDPNKPAESYNELPLADGTILKYTGDLAVGAKCLLVTPEGEVPAPEGEMAAADGTTIVIKKEGEDSVIAEIKPVAMNDQAIQAMVEKAVNAKFEAIEKENKALKIELEATKLKLAKKSSQLSDLGTVVEAMASIGVGEPINKPTENKPKRLSPPIEKPLL